MSFDALQFIPVQCISHGFGHFNHLIVVTVAPIVLLCCVVAAFETYKAIQIGSVERFRQQAKRHYIAYYMQFMLIVLPGISQKICESFRCNRYDGASAF